MQSNTTSTAQAARLVQDAVEALRRARRSDALAILQDCADWPAPYDEQAWLIRAEILTHEDAVRALEDLAAHSDAFKTSEGQFGYYIASARAYTKARNFDAAAGMLDSAEALLTGPDDPNRARVAHHRTRLMWSVSDYDPRSEHFAYSTRDPDPAVRFAALVVRAWMYGSLEQYREQLQELLAALQMFKAHGYRCDLTMVATALQSTLQLAFELGDNDAVRSAAGVYETIDWTPDIQVYRFLCLRSLAWHDFLQGEPARAQWLFKDSKELAPTQAWKVIAHVDRAYVARINGNEIWATEELHQAHSLARSIQWQMTHDEERVALMMLAVLFAPLDMAQAQRYVSTYIRIGKDAMDPTIGAAHDSRRAIAHEKYAAGRVQAVLGNPALAVRQLETSYQIFSQIEHNYRAALAAQALYELTKEETWLRAARSHAAIFPKSALYQKLSEDADEPEDEVFDSLTATQRQIARAYCYGADLEEISQRFSRSVFTLQKQSKLSMPRSVQPAGRNCARPYSDGKCCERKQAPSHNALHRLRRFLQCGRPVVWRSPREPAGSCRRCADGRGGDFCLRQIRFAPRRRVDKRADRKTIQFTGKHSGRIFYRRQRVPFLAHKRADGNDLAPQRGRARWNADSRSARPSCLGVAAGNAIRARARSRR